jgi:type VI secretion system secreted protein Hcp
MGNLITYQTIAYQGDGVMSISKLIVPLFLSVLTASAFAVPAIQSPVPYERVPAVLASASPGAQQITLEFTLPPGPGGHDHTLGKLPVTSFQYTAASPRDTSTGLATGRRQHETIVIVREVDAASPKLYQAMGDGSIFPSAILTFTRLGASPAQPETRYTVVLSQVLVTGLRPLAEPKTGSDTHELEEVQLTFRQITMTRTSGSKSATDDWLESK